MSGSDTVCSLQYLEVKKGNKNPSVQAPAQTNQTKAPSGGPPVGRTHRQSEGPRPLGCPVQNLDVAASFNKGPKQVSYSQVKGLAPGGRASPTAVQPVTGPHLRLGPQRAALRA